MKQERQTSRLLQADKDADETKQEPQTVKTHFVPGDDAPFELDVFSLLSNQHNNFKNS